MMADAETMEARHAVDWSEIEGRLADWHRRKFGHDDAGLERYALKAAEEAGELCKAALEGDLPHALEEAADLCMVLLNLCRAAGSDLRAECAKKLPVIERRLEGTRATQQQ